MSDKKSFPLRLDPTLYKEIETWAQAELRSVNGQIEYLLKLSVERRKRGADQEKSSKEKPLK
jgi:hypothetical protein